MSKYKYIILTGISFNIIIIYNKLLFVIIMRYLLRALKAGSESPLLVTIPGKTFPNSWSVSLLGALNELYLVSVAESYMTCTDLSCIGFIY